MKAKILATLLLLLSTSAFAGLEEARLAYQQGDFAKGIKEFTRLAEQGDVNAQLTLGALYHSSNEIPRDHTLAVKWLEKAALQGNVDAQYLLAVDYARGQGVPQDSTLAVSWHKKAAAQGLLASIQELGRCYLAGEGVAQNDSAAYVWYSKAAAKNSAKDQTMLGMLNYLGTGVPENTSLALFWLRKAAMQNHADAYALMATIYNGGRVSKDPVLAYALYNLAMDNLLEIARHAPKERDKLANQLTPEQREAASQLFTQLAKPDNFDNALTAYLAKSK